MDRDMSHLLGSVDTALSSQSSGLRRLARALLGDEHLVEDVVQDTWLRALRDPGSRTIVNPSAWLRRVARRLALNNLRTEGRRRHHEGLAATEEPIASADEVAASREVMHRVLAAVLELREPYQTVVWMRYYEDLSPRRIARATGTRPATVASQLHRGRELLRARLDGLYDGDRGTWAVALASVVRPAARLAAGASSRWLTVLAASSVAAGAVGLLLLARSSSGPAAGGRGPSVGALAANDGRDVPDELAGAAPAAAGQDGERAPVALPTEPAVAPPLGPSPHVFELALAVADENDVPRPGVQVLLAPEGHPVNSVGATDADGRLELRWRARAARMEVDLGLRESGQLVAGMQRLTLEAGRPRELRLPLAAPLHAAPGEPCAWRSEPEGGVFDEIAWAGREADGTLRFGWPGRSAEEVEGFALEDFSVEGPSSPVEVEHAHVRGNVLDAGGAPVGNAVILVRSAAGWWVTRADDEGAFDVPLEPEGEYELRAGGGSHGLAHHRIAFPEDDPALELSWTAVLDRGNEVRGTLDSDRLWLATCTVGDHVDSVGAAGAFAITNLPAGTGYVDLFRPEAWPFVVRRETVSVPSPFELDLRDLDGPIREGRVELPVPAGERERRMHARLTQVSTGHSAWLAYDAETGRFARSGLPPGLYRLSAGDDVGGRQDLGEIAVEADTTHAAGPARPPLPGVLDVSVAGEEPLEGVDWTVYRRGEAFDSRLVAIDDWYEGPLYVAPGTYLVVTHRDGDQSVGRRVEVSSGRTTVVQVDPSELGELVLSGRLAGEEPQPFTLVRDGEPVYAHEIAPGRDLRVFLVAGRYLLRAGELEIGVRVEAGEAVRVDG